MKQTEMKVVVFLGKKKKIETAKQTNESFVVVVFRREKNKKMIETVKQTEI